MTRQKICLLLVLSHHNWRGIHSFAPLLPSKWVAVSRTKVGTGLFATPEEPAAARRSGRKTAKTITKTPEPPSALDTQVEALEESELPNFPFKSSTREPSSKTIPWLQRFQDSVFLGVPPTFEICAIMTIYFVEGALGLTQLAQTYMLKDELGLGPAQASALGGLLILPWTLKPLYGFLSDGFPLFGSKRRSYLVLCGLIGCLADIALGFSGSIGGNVLYSTLGLLITSSACIAFSDVVADGMVVQQTRREGDSQAGALQSLCWGSAAVGGLVSAYFSGWLLETMSPRQVFGLSALLPLMVSTIAFWIKEEEGTTTQEPSMDAVTDQVKALWSALKQPNIWKPALFMFLWQSTPSSSSAFLYFMTNELGFGPEFLGRAKLVTNLSSLVGVWLYQKYLRTVPIRDLLFGSTVVSAPLGLTTLLLITHANRSLGIPDGAFVLGDDVVMGILGQVAFLPTLVLAARLCPPGVEAVLFATLMSLYNASSTVSTELGALLTQLLGVTETNFDNLGLLTILCNVSSLIPLLWIGWLDEVGSQSEQELEEQKQESYTIDTSGRQQSS